VLSTAAQAVDTAYAPLSSTASSYQSSLAACGNNLSCVHPVDSRMSQAFAKFGTDMQGISMPSAAANQQELRFATAVRGLDRMLGVV
jgi:hypothetical protein